jgi:hypothetical protein
VNKAGWLSFINLTISSFETEDEILFCGICDDGLEGDAETCQRIFSLPATVEAARSSVPGKMKTNIKA